MAYTLDGIIQLQEAAKWADDAFQAALVEDFGKNAGDMRYSILLPSRIQLLRMAKLAADDKYLNAVHEYRATTV